MRTKIDSIAALKKYVADLPWNAHKAEVSLRKALSSAQLTLGLDQQTAFEILLDVSASEFLRENQHLFFQIWRENEVLKSGNNRDGFDDFFTE